MVQEFPYVAMDTEFPGVVARPIGEFKSTSDYQYQVMSSGRRVEDVSMKWKDRPSVAEMYSGGVYEMERQTMCQKKMEIPLKCLTFFMIFGKVLECVMKSLGRVFKKCIFIHILGISALAIDLHS